MEPNRRARGLNAARSRNKPADPGTPNDELSISATMVSFRDGMLLLEMLAAQQAKHDAMEMLAAQQAKHDTMPARAEAPTLELEFHLVMVRAGCYGWSACMQPKQHHTGILLLCSASPGTMIVHCAVHKFLMCRHPAAFWA